MNLEASRLSATRPAVFLITLLCARLLAHGADSAPPADQVKFAGLEPEAAAREATLPPGFRMHVFAAEPDVRQPIAFCLDDRGRVWVAEGFTYPKRAPEGQGKDRILVLEDTNGDHRFDRRHVFMENVNLISGLEVGFGGVWIGAAPYLMFVPVSDWDAPKPAGEPQILLDGWDYTADTHETLNTFAWGPDGWLYGCHGVFCPSLVGKPGSEESARQWVDAAAWRFHPVEHRFEIFTEGGSNPWGLDFDEHGQLWTEMCVIPHLWHMIQGARIQRQGGQHYCTDAAETARNAAYRDSGSRKPNYPFAYEPILQHADHVHWTGHQGPHAANARSDAAGGGHAHAGLMVYLGASWPESYRGKLFIGNIHGQRLNMDIIERRGSGFVGRHGPDFLNFNDTWSQTLNQLYDHDGSVYIIDWYDKNQCHHNREDGHDRANGRIYKVVYNNQAATRLDLALKTDAELVALATSTNEFLSRHARRILQERVALAARQESAEDLPPAFAEFAKLRSAGAKMTALGPLRQIVDTSTRTPERLRALWTLHLAGAISLEDTGRWIRDPDEWIRAWTIRLFFERAPLLFSNDDRVADLANRSIETLARLAREDASPLVRLHVGSALRRVPAQRRLPVLLELARHGEDATDHNLPLLYWYAAEGTVAAEPAAALELIQAARIPKLREFAARRVTTADFSVGRPGRAGHGARLAELLLARTEPEFQLDLLRGMAAALKGQRDLPMPAGWDAAEAALGQGTHPEIRALSQYVSLAFGSQKAIAALTGTLQDRNASAILRRGALDALMTVRPPSLAATLRNLLGDSTMRGSAIRALAGFNDPSVADSLLAAFPALQESERREAINTLASRAAFAVPLLDSIRSERVPRAILTADLIRQLRNLRDPAVNAQLTELYGSFRDTSPDIQREIERYKRIYRAGGSQPGDASRGRAVYDRVCAQCHVLFDAGGKIGPDLTGSNRSDLDYILQNILDPNAVIPHEYRATTIDARDGRSLTGLLRQQDDRTVTLQTQTETLTLPRSEVESIKQTELSMMPEGLLAPLADQEVRDLIYYLGRPGQAPPPAAAAAAP